MPKIRGIKPEIWTDENFVELSMAARLLFIGMWNFACDNGHLEEKSRQLKMRVLPTDDVNCAELLREIEALGLIERAGGWITIPNLSHHQKPHRRWWSTCDKPGCVLPEGASHAPINRGATVAPPKRNRGATADGDGDGDGDKNTVTAADPKASSTDVDGAFDEFWTSYPRKVDKGHARKAWKAAVKKAKPAAIIEGCQRFAADVASSKTEARYVAHAATWLNGERWSDHAAEEGRSAGEDHGPIDLSRVPPELAHEQPPSGLSQPQYRDWYMDHQRRMREAAAAG